ncbi:integrase [Peribacillus butanolivorans]|uniref:integrase n=1 Tax=Peribacillus butanolivorans TaxID=421767 RepID=UPI0037C869C4
MKEIRQRLEHTDIQTTMNIYAHMTDNMEEKDSHQFSQLMEDLQLQIFYMLSEQIGEHLFTR